VSHRLREEFFKLLKEDEEFRFAILGYLGISEILKRLDDNTKAIKSLQEQVYELQKEVREHSKAIRELQEETHKQSEAIKELQRQVSELVKTVGEVKVAVGSLGRRLGRQFERLVFEVYRDALESRGISPGKVEKFIHVDYDGRYTGKPGFKLEIDMYIHDQELYLLEVKSLVEEDDVEWFMQKCEIAEKILNRKASRRIILGVNVVKEAIEIAKRYGVDIIYGSIIE